MRVHRHPVIVALAFAAAAVGCGGGGEPPKAPPPPPAKAPALPSALAQLAKPVRPGHVNVFCLAQWTSGPTGKFTCTPLGGAPVTVTKDTFVLDKICVNDVRLTKYTMAGGETAAINAQGDVPDRCMTFDAVKQLPETCICEPPAGGDCSSPPSEGFKCLAAGSVKREGGA